MLSIPFTFNNPVSLSSLTSSQRFGTLINGDLGSIVSSSSSVAGGGDINGDGIDDVVIGSSQSSPHSKYQAGSSFVVFGNKNPNYLITLSSLNGNNGFIINGIAATDYSGCSVAGSGDINGDGLSDIVIGASGTSSNQAGSSFVIFGSRAQWSSTLELAALNGTNGFRINGISGNSGTAVALVDINNDGLDDIVIGAPNASPSGRTQAGSVFVVFGNSIPWNSTFSLSNINGINGFRLNGATSEQIGNSVSNAGDINGDGIEDILTTSPYLYKNYGTSSYVLFGKKGSWEAAINTVSINGINGFRICGYCDRPPTQPNNVVFTSASNIGDINGDKVSDIGVATTHATYVILGNKNGWNSTFDVIAINGNNGFIIVGDITGTTYRIVAGKVDFNGDGFNDIVIGKKAQPSYYQSSIYTIFGQKTWNSTFDLSKLNGNNGFRIDPLTTEPFVSVSDVSGAGDFNNDGLDDIITGTPSGNYVVFGENPRWITNQLTIQRGQSIPITLSNLNISVSRNLELTSYSISSALHGQFEYVARPETPITGFSYSDVATNLLRFVHDGSLLPPGYTVRASYLITASTLPAAITFINPLSSTGTSIFSSAVYATASSSSAIALVSSTVISSSLSSSTSSRSTGPLLFPSSTSPFPSFSGMALESSSGILPLSSSSPSVSSAGVFSTAHSSSAIAVASSTSMSSLTSVSASTGGAGPLLFSSSSALLFSSSGLSSTMNSASAASLDSSSGILPLSSSSSSANIAPIDLFSSSGGMFPAADEVTAGNNNLARNIAIGGGAAAGVLLFGFCVFRRYRNKQNNNSYKKMFESNDIDVESPSQGMANLLPLTTELFKQFKTTGLCGSKNEDVIKDYISALAGLLRKLKEQGINPNSSDENECRFLKNEIISEIRKQIVAPKTKNIQGWFISFVRANVKPEELVQKASSLATAIAHTYNLKAATPHSLNASVSAQPFLQSVATDEIELSESKTQTLLPMLGNPINRKLSEL